MSAISVSIYENYTEALIGAWSVDSTQWSQYIGLQLRFLPTCKFHLHASDAPVMRVPVGISPCRLVWNKNLAIANRSRVSCAHNALRASIGINITP